MAPYKIFAGLGLALIGIGMLWPTTLVVFGIPGFLLPSANTNRFIVMMILVLAVLLLVTERAGRWVLAALVAGGVGMLYRGIGAQALLHDLGTVFQAVGLYSVARVLMAPPPDNGHWLALIFGIAFVVAAVLFSPQEKARR